MYTAPPPPLLSFPVRPVNLLDICWCCCCCCFVCRSGLPSRLSCVSLLGTIQMQQLTQIQTMNAAARDASPTRRKVGAACGVDGDVTCWLLAFCLLAVLLPFLRVGRCWGRCPCCTGQCTPASHARCYLYTCMVVTLHRHPPIFVPFSTTLGGWLLDFAHAVSCCAVLCSQGSPQASHQPQASPRA
jgi:hypothetical protein